MLEDATLEKGVVGNPRCNVGDAVRQRVAGEPQLDGTIIDRKSHTPHVRCRVGGVAGRANVREVERASSLDIDNSLSARDHALAGALALPRGGGVILRGLVVGHRIVSDAAEVLGAAPSYVLLTDPVYTGIAAFAVAWRSRLAAASFISGRMKFAGG
jgi:hypothetical protein